MSVVDVQAVLTQAVHESLTELAKEEPGLVVNHHLTVFQDITYCPGDEDDDDGVGHFNSTLQWRLNLFFLIDGKQYMALVGVLPYQMCADGDVEPMKCLVKQLWREKSFGHLMLDSQLDAELNRVAAEIEGGS